MRPGKLAMSDLAVYRVGSLALADGRSLYTVVAGPDHLHFTYPPFAAVFLSPFAVLPWSFDRLALTLVTVGCYAFALRLVIGRLNVESAPWPSWCLPVALSAAIWLEPFRSTVNFGQINVLLMAMILADLLLVRSTRWSGALIGIAAAVKLTPLAFFPYLFVSGRRRAGVNAVAGFVASGLMGFVADPSASREYWGQRMFLEAHRVGLVENASNQTVRGILARLLRTAAVPGWWVVVAILVFAAGLAVAVQLSRAGYLTWSVTVMAIAMLCVSPISWSHHWVWSAPMLLVCADLVRRRRSLWAWLATALVMLPFFVGMIFWAPHSGDHELTDSFVQQVLSASYILAAALLAGMLAFAARDAPA
jgi:alpha-1,2-mannosyltransferase